MAQQLMWNHIDSNYRGQASNGTVVTVEQEALQLVLSKAGKTVYDTDWWIESLPRVFEHWGVFSKRWTDAATQTPRMLFTLGEPPADAPADTSKQTTPTTAPLSSGPLTNRIQSGPLTTKELNKDERNA